MNATSKRRRKQEPPPIVNKSCRQKKNYQIEEDVLMALFNREHHEKVVTKTNLDMSDIVNLALRQFLKPELDALAKASA